MPSFCHFSLVVTMSHDDVYFICAAMTRARGLITAAIVAGSDEHR